MLLHGKPGIMFKCKDMTCLLNDTFNIVVFTEGCAVQKKQVHSVGFIVPVRYIDFIKTVSIMHTLETKLTDIFEFTKSEDMRKLQEFVSKQPKTPVYKIISSLCPKKPVTKQVLKY